MDHAQLLRAVRRAVQRRKDAKTAEDEATLAALRAGVKLDDLIVAADSSRETLRRLARKNDIPLRREPTVVSKRHLEAGSEQAPDGQ